MGMALIRTSVVVLSLGGLVACGPGLPGGSPISSSDSGGTGPMMQLCYFNGDEYQSGEEYETQDGCYRYVCNEGIQEIVEDNSIVEQGDLLLDTQVAVDQRICLTGVNGTMTLTGAVTDPSPMARLSRVGTDLVVDASNIQNLNMQTLSEVGGSIIISNNEQLTAMAFQPFMSIFGDAEITNNDALTNLNGAGFLGQCTTCAGAPNEDEPVPASDSGDGLEPEQPGGQFYGGILIADNDVLTDLSAMSSLLTAWDDLILRNNAALSSFPNMQLTEVQGNLEISDHPALDTTVVDTFVSGVTVLGTTTVCGNLGGTPCP